MTKKHRRLRQKAISLYKIEFRAVINLNIEWSGNGGYARRNFGKFTKCGSGDSECMEGGVNVVIPPDTVMHILAKGDTTFYHCGG